MNTIIISSILIGVIGYWLALKIEELEIRINDLESEVRELREATGIIYTDEINI